MPRIYEIAKKFQLENKDVLVKARALGITAAKVPSSMLDKISAEFLEEELIKDRPEIISRQLPPTPNLKFPLATQKPKITITATGAELYRLAEKVINQGIEVNVNVSETEHGEPLHLCLVRNPSQKPLDSKPAFELPARVEIDERTKDLLRAAYYASRHNAVDDWVNLAEYGGAVKRLNPNFQPQELGERSLGALLRRVTDLFELRNDENNPIVYYLRMKQEKPQPVSTVPTTINTASQLTKATSSATPTLAKGKIHNLKLGFGFIMPDDGSDNLFFHASNVEGCTIFDLKPGDPVEYESVMNEKGPFAQKVRRLK